LLSLGGLGLGCGSDAVPYANEVLLGTSPSSFFSECKRPAAIQRHSWSSFVPSTSGLPTKTRSPSWGHSRWQGKRLSLSAPVRVVLCVGGHRARTAAEMGDAHTRVDAMRCGRGFARAGTSLSNSGHLATRLFDMYSTCIEAAPRRLRLRARSRKELRGAAEAKPANS
jgi:hypothetical protein